MVKYTTPFNLLQAITMPPTPSEGTERKYDETEVGHRWTIEELLEKAEASKLMPRQTRRPYAINAHHLVGNAWTRAAFLELADMNRKFPFNQARFEASLQALLEARWSDLRGITHVTDQQYTGYSEIPRLEATGQDMREFTTLTRTFPGLVDFVAQVAQRSPRQRHDKFAHELRLNWKNREEGPLMHTVDIQGEQLDPVGGELLRVVRALVAVQVVGVELGNTGNMVAGNVIRGVGFEIVPTDNTRRDSLDLFPKSERGEWNGGFCHSALKPRKTSRAAKIFNARQRAFSSALCAHMRRTAQAQPDEESRRAVLTFVGNGTQMNGVEVRLDKGSLGQEEIELDIGETAIVQGGYPEEAWCLSEGRFVEYITADRASGNIKYATYDTGLDDAEIIRRLRDDPDEPTYRKLMEILYRKLAGGDVSDVGHNVGSVRSGDSRQKR